MTSYRMPDGRRRRKRRRLGIKWTTLEILTRRGIVTMVGRLHQGWTVWDWKLGDVRRSVWPSDWSYEELKVPKRKGRRGSAEAATIVASTESRLFAGLPHLVEHISAREWDDGSPRTPGLIMIMTRGSTWQVLAKEPDEKLKLVVYMPTIDDALLQLELLLGSDEAPWEPDTYQKPASASKSKK